MIVDLPSSNTSAVNRKLVEMRASGGALTMGRVLTLVIVTEDGAGIEDSIAAANSASHEHPCRIIVLARGQRKAAPRLDAQIRVGGDAGASEVVVLRGYGPLAADEAGAGMVMPLLLPDAPVVAWWPEEAPTVPSQDPVGRLATRRITDALSAKNPMKAFEQRRASYVDGDTDLTWTRLTPWRALLATALDAPPWRARPSPLPPSCSQAGSRCGWIPRSSVRPRHPVPGWCRCGWSAAPVPSSSSARTGRWARCASRGSRTGWSRSPAGRCVTASPRSCAGSTPTRSTARRSPGSAASPAVARR
jgi:hypothetical protein